MTNKHVEAIINTWKKDGNKIHPSDPKLPLHPELVYRIKGSWTTWNSFKKQRKIHLISTFKMSKMLQKIQHGCNIERYLNHKGNN